MSDLNNANPTPPEDAKARADHRAAELKQNLQKDEKNNDSSVAPEKTKDEALRGFHGG